MAIEVRFEHKGTSSRDVFSTASGARVVRNTEQGLEYLEVVDDETTLGLYPWDRVISMRSMLAITFDEGEPGNPRDPR